MIWRFPVTVFIEVIVVFLFLIEISLVYKVNNIFIKWFPY